MTTAMAQHAFADALLDPTRGIPAGLRADGGDLQRRFAVHRNNIVVALVEALASAFPVTRALVGETFFRAMARERVAAEPPSSRLIVEYGEGFGEFIAGFAAAASLPCLADVARLEWLRTRAFHAADAQPVDAAALAQLAAQPQRLAGTGVRLHPACHWLRSNYAVLSLWLAHQALDDPATAELGAIDVAHAQDVLVARPALDVRCVALPAGGAIVLNALRAGLTLGEAIHLAGNADTDTQTELLLALIVEHGLITELHTPADN